MDMALGRQLSEEAPLKQLKAEKDSPIHGLGGERNVRVRMCCGQRGAWPAARPGVGVEHSLMEGKIPGGGSWEVQPR